MDKLGNISNPEIKRTELGSTAKYGKQSEQY
jgi:hypothetical protein